jgi:hypothetical protein
MAFKSVVGSTGKENSFSSLTLALKDEELIFGAL